MLHKTYLNKQTKLFSFGKEFFSFPGKDYAYNEKLYWHTLTTDNTVYHCALVHSVVLTAALCILRLVAVLTCGMTFWTHSPEL